MRVRERESVFRNSTKRLEFMSATVRGLRAQAQNENWVREQMLFWRIIVTKRTTLSLSGVSIYPTGIHGGARDGEFHLQYFQKYWIYWAPLCFFTTLFIFLIVWYFACFSLHILSFHWMRPSQKWQRKSLVSERRIKTWWKMATFKNQG